MTATTCPHCSGLRIAAGYPTADVDGTRYTIDSCAECGASFLSPRPSDEALARAYSSEYYGEGERKFARPIETLIEFFRSARGRRVESLIQAPARVLDVGCGNGHFLRYLQRGGYQCYGVELDGKAADRVAQIPELKLHRGVFDASVFQGEQFDVVTLWHVVEHLPDTADAMSQLSRLVRKDGYLIFSLPNIQSIQSRVFLGRWFHLDPPRHLIFFPPAKFIDEVEKRGFKIVRSNFFSIEQNPFGIQQSLLNCILRHR